MKKQGFDILILKVYQWLITGSFWILLIFLSWLAMTGTCAIDKADRTYFLRDSAVWNILILSLPIIVGTFSAKSAAVLSVIDRIENDPIIFVKLRRLLLVIHLIASFIWVISTQFIPQIDQLDIQTAVFNMGVENFSDFAVKGTMSRYHNQIGLTLICYLFSKLFGSYNYLMFQLVNSVALVVIFYEFAVLAEEWGMRRITQLTIILLGMLFFPLTLYTSLLYGNLIGLALAVTSIRYAMVFFRIPGIVQGVLSIVSMLLAVSVKSNYLIFLMGLLIFSVAELIRTKNIRFLFYSMTLLLGCFIVSGAMVFTAEKISGEKLDQGMSAWSWIAMGLQDGNYQGQQRAEGWWNGYGSISYIESGQNQAIQAQMAKESIMKSIDGFLADKGSGMRFFSRKTASQWNNPTFQAFNNVQSLKSQIRIADWVWWLLTPNCVDKAAGILDRLQFMILMGAIFYLIFNRNQDYYGRSLIFAIIFLGGFLFHLFWEAKCQYTLSYFVILIPYAAGGTVSIITKLHRYLMRISKQNESAKTVFFSFAKKQIGMTVLSGIVILALFGLYSGNRSEYLYSDDIQYEEYLEANRVMKDVSEGTYYLYSTSKQEGYGITLEKDEKTYECHMTTQPMPVKLSFDQGYYRLCFTKGNRYITADNSERPYEIEVNEFQDSVYQKWLIEKLGDSRYAIFFGDEVLTYDIDNDTVYMSTYHGEDGQIWNISE